MNECRKLLSAMIQSNKKLIAALESGQDPRYVILALLIQNEKLAELRKTLKAR